MIINPQVAIDEGWITFPEEPINDQQLQPNGIDLRLKIAWKVPIHTPFKLYKDRTCHLNRYRAEGSLHKDIPVIIMERMMCYNVESFEFVSIPENVAAYVIGRSSLNRNGVFCRSTLYDSGFKDYVGAAVYPFVPCHLHYGARFAQIIFMEAQSAKMYDGQYQLHESNRRHSD